MKRMLGRCASAARDTMPNIEVRIASQTKRRKAVARESREFTRMDGLNDLSQRQINSWVFQACHSERSEESN
jgi:hypothetical protein